MFSQDYSPDGLTISQLVDPQGCGSIGSGMLHFWKQNRLLPPPTYSSPRNAECKIRLSLKRFSKKLWALGTPLFTNSDSSLDAQILLDGTLWVSSHDDDWGVKKSKNQLKFIKLAKVKLEFEFSLTPEDQTLSLWSGSTDSKTLDYQRTNPKEYQISENLHKGNHLNTRSSNHQ